MSEINEPAKRSERRAQPRHAAPVLVITIADKAFQTQNWSMAGMVLEKYKGPLTVGAIFEISAIARASEKDKPHKVTVSGRVTRAEVDGGIVAFNFMELDNEAFVFLQECMAERMKLLNEEATNY